MADFRAQRIIGGSETEVAVFGIADLKGLRMKAA
jgi:hypothetical protein